MKTLFDINVFHHFIQPGEVVEVRILGARGKSPAWGNEWARGTVSGYFDSHEEFCEKVQLADKAQHAGIYFTLQVIDPRLIGRAYNRLRVSDLTTSDKDVVAYRWLPIDLDPVRPSGIASSDSELQAAMQLREQVAEWVRVNLSFPEPIKGMSGNGAHLLFRLPDLPVNEQTTAFIRSTLQGLASQFNNDRVTIDTSVFNPARIWKLYGTTARKGDEIPGRPHRMSYIDNLGEPK
jgi:hypothetical protein